MKFLRIKFLALFLCVMCGVGICEHNDSINNSNQPTDSAVEAFKDGRLDPFWEIINKYKEAKDSEALKELAGKIKSLKGEDVDGAEDVASKLFDLAKEIEEKVQKDEPPKNQEPKTSIAVPATPTTWGPKYGAPSSPKGNVQGAGNEINAVREAIKKKMQIASGPSLPDRKELPNLPHQRNLPDLDSRDAWKLSPEEIKAASEAEKKVKDRSLSTPERNKAALDYLYYRAPDLIFDALQNGANPEEIGRQFFGKSRAATFLADRVEELTSPASPKTAEILARFKESTGKEVPSLFVSSLNQLSPTDSNKILASLETAFVAKGPDGKLNTEYTNDIQRTLFQDLSAPGGREAIDRLFSLTHGQAQSTLSEAPGAMGDYVRALKAGRFEDARSLLEALQKSTGKDYPEKELKTLQSQLLYDQLILSNHRGEKPEDNKLLRELSKQLGLKETDVSQLAAHVKTLLTEGRGVKAFFDYTQFQQGRDNPDETVMKLMRALSETQTILTGLVKQGESLFTQESAKRAQFEKEFRAKLDERQRLIDQWSEIQKTVIRTQPSFAILASNEHREAVKALETARDKIFISELGIARSQLHLGEGQSGLALKPEEFFSDPQFFGSYTRALVKHSADAGLGMALDWIGDRNRNSGYRGEKPETLLRQELLSRPTADRKEVNQVVVDTRHWELGDPGRQLNSVETKIKEARTQITQIQTKIETSPWTQEQNKKEEEFKKSLEARYGVPWSVLEQHLKGLETSFDRSQTIEMGIVAPGTTLPGREKLKSAIEAVFEAPRKQATETLTAYWGPLAKGQLEQFQKQAQGLGEQRDGKAQELFTQLNNQNIGVPLGTRFEFRGGSTQGSFSQHIETADKATELAFGVPMGSQMIKAAQQLALQGVSYLKVGSDDKGNPILWSTGRFGNFTDIRGKQLGMSGVSPLLPAEAREVVARARVAAGNLDQRLVERSNLTQNPSGTDFVVAPKLLSLNYQIRRGLDELTAFGNVPLNSKGETAIERAAALTGWNSQTEVDETIRALSVAKVQADEQRWRDNTRGSQIVLSLIPLSKVTMLGRLASSFQSATGMYALSQAQSDLTHIFNNDVWGMNTSLDYRAANNQAKNFFINTLAFRAASNGFSAVAKYGLSPLVESGKISQGLANRLVGLASTGGAVVTSAGVTTMASGDPGSYYRNLKISLVNAAIPYSVFGGKTWIAASAGSYLTSLGQTGLITALQARENGGTVYDSSGTPINYNDGNGWKNVFRTVVDNLLPDLKATTVGATRAVMGTRQPMHTAKNPPIVMPVEQPGRSDGSPSIKPTLTLPPPPPVPSGPLRQFSEAQIATVTNALNNAVRGKMTEAEMQGLIQVLLESPSLNKTGTVDDLAGKIGPLLPGRNRGDVERVVESASKWIRGETKNLLRGIQTPEGRPLDHATISLFEAKAIRWALNPAEFGKKQLIATGPELEKSVGPGKSADFVTRSSGGEYNIGEAKAATGTGGAEFKIGQLENTARHLISKNPNARFGHFTLFIPEIVNSVKGHFIQGDQLYSSATGEPVKVTIDGKVLGPVRVVRIKNESWPVAVASDPGFKGFEDVIERVARSRGLKPEDLSIGEKDTIVKFERGVAELRAARPELTYAEAFDKLLSISELVSVDNRASQLNPKGGGKKKSLDPVVSDILIKLGPEFLDRPYSERLKAAEQALRANYEIDENTGYRNVRPDGTIVETEKLLPILSEAIANIHPVDLGPRPLFRATAVDAKGFDLTKPQDLRRLVEEDWGWQRDKKGYAHAGPDKKTTESFVEGVRIKPGQIGVVYEFPPGTRGFAVNGEGPIKRNGVVAHKTDAVVPNDTGILFPGKHFEPDLSSVRIVDGKVHVRMKPIK